MWSRGETVGSYTKWGLLWAYRGHGRAQQSEHKAYLAHWSATPAVFQPVLERRSLLGAQPCREKDQKSHFGLKDEPLELETLSSESWLSDVPTQTEDKCF